MTDSYPTLEPPAAAKPPWYRRRAILVSLGVVIVLAITVITDLPTHTSIAAQVSEETTVLNEVKSDAAPCVTAVGEAFGFYADVTKGSLTPSEQASLPRLLQDDQASCSFTSEYVYDLSGIEVPGTAAGRDVGGLVSTVTLWVTSDALAAIDAIIDLTTDPTNATQVAALGKAERLLASDRASVDAELHAADGALGGAHLPSPGLPTLPSPVGAS
jgi:hypothetical protein